MQMLFMAHSGLRYLVLLAGIAAVLYLAFAVGTRKLDDRTGKMLGSTFVGLLDLQGLLGILMVAFGLFYPALMGHIFMMIMAAVVAHVSMVLAKSRSAKANAIRLAGVVVALLLIAGGIMSIGRQVFGSGAPTVIQ